MNFILLPKLPEDRMTESFFRRVIYAVWYFYKDLEIIELLNTSGELYRTVYSERIMKLFPVVDEFDYSARMQQTWTRYIIECGCIVVRDDILDSYKKYAEIDDNCDNYKPNFEAALKALEDLKNRRADRFTWHPDDLVVYESKEEFEKAIAKEGRTVTWL